MDFKKKNTIILFDSITYFENQFRDKEILVYNSFRNVSLFGKILRKCSQITKIGRSKWFGEWKNNLENINTVIVFAQNRIDHLVEIKKKHPHIRIILWYWNPVSQCIHPDEVPETLCEKWSFDRDDCDQYNLNYNHQFYFDNIHLKESPFRYDGFFLGINKGRRDYLNVIKKVFEENGLRGYFYIIPDRNEKNEEQLKPLSYAEYLEQYISCTKAIIDVQPKKQSGLTLRPLESIFFNKKLITNNINIKECDFYKPSNIFIIGLDDDKLLKQFIETEYIEVSTEIIKKYDVLDWLNNFFI